MKQGRVIRSTGSWYQVDTGDEIIDSRLPGKFRLEDKKVTNPVTVGDVVDITINDDGSGSINKIHERRNYLTRKATHGRQGEHILISNLDEAFVVQSVRQPKLKQGFIDRFLVTCEAYEVKGSLIINKTDLGDERSDSYIDHITELYTGLGYNVIQTSIHAPDSIRTLREALKDQVSVLIGPSGTGKTSLLNEVDPQTTDKVGEVSSYSGKGKHTTTFARLIKLQMGGYLADTPGIREFGLFNIEPWELSLFFPEMLEPRTECRFNTCTHAHEPDCGVMQAYENGQIDPGRYDSYLSMLESIS